MKDAASDEEAKEMKMTKLSPHQALILAFSVLAMALLACNLNPVMRISPSTSTAEVIFSAPETVMALATDKEENVYAITVEGNVLKIAPDGKSEQIYSGLERCGFSDRTLTVLPNGDVIVNDCVEKKDTLIKIDREGNKTTLIQLEGSLTSMTSDSSGKLYLGFWTSQGNISVNFQPTTYLGGADDIGGHVSVLGQDGQLESLYEGGIPLSLAASEGGELYAAIWGQKGQFKPESKSYSMCGPTKNFWIGLSEQVEIQHLAPDRKDPIVKRDSHGVFSHIAVGKEGLLLAFGKSGEGECGIYQIKQGRNPQKLSLTKDDADKNVTNLAISDSNLYFSDVDGNVYRVGLKNLVTASEAAELPVAPSPTTAATQPPPAPLTATPVPPTNTPALSAVSATDTPQATPVPPSPTAIPPSTLQVTQLALYEDAANYFAWPPDSKSLVIAASKIILYDVQTTKTREISSSSPRQVAFSPNGTMLAAAAYDGVKLWDTAGWGELRTLAGSQDTESVAFSPDGTMLATATGSAVKLWDVASGNELRTLPGGGSVGPVAFSPDGRIVAAGAGLAGQEIKLWDVASGDELRSLTGHSNWVKSVVFSPDGSMLASGSVDSTVRLWDVTTGRQLRALTGHTGQVESVAFSPDGRLLASASWDLTVRLWDVTSGKELVSLTGHTDWIHCVAFSPDGTMLASGSGDRMLLWRIESGVTAPEPTPTLSPPVSTVTPVPLSESAISPNNAGQVTQLALLDENMAQQVAWSPDGNLLVTVSGKIYFYDAQTLKQTGLIDAGGPAAFSPDGTTLAAPSRDGVKLWDTTGWGELHTFAGSKGTESLAFSPDGRMLATAIGGTVKLWDVASGKELRTIPADSSVTTVAFSPDGRTVASGGLADVRLWDVVSGNELRILKGHSNWINSVVFSPDGQTLASGSVDSTVRLWDVATGRQLRALTGHTKDVTSVAFSPDGRLLASASRDLTVKLWDVASGRELVSLTGHTEQVTSVAFSPDGALLASGSFDGTVRLWGLAP